MGNLITQKIWTKKHKYYENPIWAGFQLSSLLIKAETWFPPIPYSCSLPQTLLPCFPWGLLCPRSRISRGILGGQQEKAGGEVTHHIQKSLYQQRSVGEIQALSPRWMFQKVACPTMQQTKTQKLTTGIHLCHLSYRKEKTYLNGWPSSDFWIAWITPLYILKLMVTDRRPKAM